MPPRRPPPPPPSEGPDWRRWAIYIAVQAVAAAVVLRKMSDTGVLDAALAYGAALNPFRTPCGFVPEAQYVLLSDRIVVPYGVLPGFGERWAPGLHWHVACGAVADAQLPPPAGPSGVGVNQHP